MNPTNPLHNTISTLAAIQENTEFDVQQTGESTEIIVVPQSANKKFMSVFHNGLRYWLPGPCPSSYAGKVPQEMVDFLERNKELFMHIVNGEQVIQDHYELELSLLAKKIRALTWLETEKDLVIKKIQEILQKDPEKLSPFSVVPADIVQTSIGNYLNPNDLASLRTAVSDIRENTSLKASILSCTSIKSAFNGNMRDIRWFLKTLIKFKETDEAFAKELIAKFFNEASVKGQQKFFRSLFAQEDESIIENIIQLFPEDLKELHISSLEHIIAYKYFSYICIKRPQIQVVEKRLHQSLNPPPAAVLGLNNLTSFTWHQPLSIIVLEQLLKNTKFKSLSIYAEGMSPTIIEKLSTLQELTKLTLEEPMRIISPINKAPLQTLQNLQELTITARLNELQDAAFLPSLKKLNLTTPFTSPLLISQVFNNCTSLTSLTLYTEDAFPQELTNALGNCKNLETLSLEIRSIEDADVQAILRACPSLKELTILPALELRITTETGEMLGNSSTLQKVHLGSTEDPFIISEIGIKNILRNPHLTSIGLIGIETLNAQLFLTLPHPEKIQELNLSRCKLTNVESLGVLRNLKSFYANQSSPHTWIEYLPQFPYLETITINGSPFDFDFSFSSQFYRDISSYQLEHLATVAPNLQEIKMTHYELSRSALEIFKKFRNLDTVSTNVPFLLKRFLNNDVINL